jgi:hypothetical protein
MTEQENRERCPVCDDVLATEADVVAFASGMLTRATVEALCWARFNPPKSCIRTPVDWRARALAAEAALTEERERGDRLLAERDHAVALSRECLDHARGPLSEGACPGTVFCSARSGPGPCARCPSQGSRPR